MVAQQEKENAARKEQADKIKAAKKRRAEFEAEVWSYWDRDRVRVGLG